MQTSLQQLRPSRRPLILSWMLLGTALLIAFLTWYHTFQQTSQHRLQLENSSGRNGKHANQKAQESAAEQFEKLKQAFGRLNSKASKTKEDNEMLKSLEKQLKHWRKKKDWKGENHSQKQKGN